MKACAPLTFPLIALALVLLAPVRSLAQPDEIVAAAARYDSAASAEPLRQLEARVRAAAADPKLRPAIENDLVLLLAPESTLAAKRFACEQLAVIGGDRSLTALKPLLASDETAGLVCLALTTYPPGNADAMLREALPTAPAKARIQIINTLGDRRDRRAVPLIAAAAREGDTPTAASAVASLGKIGDAAARKDLTAIAALRGVELAAALREAELRVAQQLLAAGERRAAAKYAEALIAPDQPTFIRRGAFDLLLLTQSDGGEKLIRATLAGSDSALKPVAIAAVRRLPSRNASATFARLLPGLPPEETVWLLDSLAARNDTEARAALANALTGSGDSTVRQAAAQALGQIGDASTVRPLAQALGTADAAENRVLLAALSSLPGTAAVEQALLIELRNASPAARPALITALAGRRSPAVYAALLDEGVRPDPATYRAAYRSLARATTAGNLPSLLDRFVALPDASQREAVEVFVGQAVLNVEPPAARSAAVSTALVKAPNLDARLALLRLLPACGDASALSLAQAARKEPDARVRVVAAAALAEWPTPTAWDALLAIYRQPDNDSQHALALGALTRLANEDNPAGPVAAARFEALLAGARGDAELKRILGAMGGARQSDVLPLALPLLGNAAVRPEAEVAVKRIAEAIKAQDPAAAAAALGALKQ